MLPKSLKAAQLAVHASSSCSAQQKVLQLFPQKEFACALYLLLQFPSIRLKKIVLVNLNEFHDYLHLCALHPDLQMTKLVMAIPTIDADHKSFLATVQADLISLFGMPSLQKISLSGNLCSYDEVKLGIVEGLLYRTRSFPIKKLTLELTDGCYAREDMKILFDAAFSLPKLDSLELVLGEGFLNSPEDENILYNCWVYKAADVKLKSLQILAHNTEFKQLSLIADSLSSSLKEVILSQEVILPQEFLESLMYCAHLEHNEYYDNDDDDNVWWGDHY